MGDPLERRLRPAYEFWGAGAAAIASGCVVFEPDLFLLSSAMAWGFSTALLGLATWRAIAGWEVLAYRRNLTAPRP